MKRCGIGKSTLKIISYSLFFYVMAYCLLTYQPTDPHHLYDGNAYTMKSVFMFTRYGEPFEGLSSCHLASVKGSEFFYCFFSPVDTVFIYAQTLFYPSGDNSK